MGCDKDLSYVNSCCLHTVGHNECTVDSSLTLYIRTTPQNEFRSAKPYCSYSLTVFSSCAGVNTPHWNYSGSTTQVFVPVASKRIWSCSVSFYSPSVLLFPCRLESWSWSRLTEDAWGEFSGTTKSTQIVLFEDSLALMALWTWSNTLEYLNRPLLCIASWGKKIIKGKCYISWA